MERRNHKNDIICIIENIAIRKPLNSAKYDSVLIIIYSLSVGGGRGGLR